ncbi:hypothetical protein BH23BAC1_BH23BAC1_27700 [soil metagenome]
MNIDEVIGKVLTDLANTHPLYILDHIEGKYKLSIHDCIRVAKRLESEKLAEYIGDEKLRMQITEHGRKVEVKLRRYNILVVSASSSMISLSFYISIFCLS